MRNLLTVSVVILAACDADGPDHTDTITTTVTSPPQACAEVDRSAAGQDLVFDPQTTLSGVYRVDGQQIYDSGEVVTVEPGTIFLMGGSASVLFGWRSDPATVMFQGTADAPILFCGTEDAAGHWKGLELLGGTTADSTVEHVRIEDAGWEDHAALLLWPSLPLRSVALVDNAGVGLDASLLHGSSDELTLTGNAWPATLRSGEAITNLPAGDYAGNVEDIIEVVSHENQDVVFHDRGVPYRQLDVRVVYGIAEGTPLSITYEAGVVYEMCQDCDILFGWRSDPAMVQALGTANAPVVFTSANPSPAPGDWNGIHLLSGTSSDSTFENVVFEFGGKASDDWEDSANLVVNAGLGTVVDCSFLDSAGYGLWLEDVEPGFTESGSVFAGNALGDVYDSGN